MFEVLATHNLNLLALNLPEWWSGGLHLVTKRHACNLQRIVSLDPDQFGLHLLYHTANNKQASIT
jgi:hypothetical protein